MEKKQENPAKKLEKSGKKKNPGKNSSQNKTARTLSPKQQKKPAASVFKSGFVVILMIAENEIMLRLVVGLALSALIGTEREVRGKPAGLHTHVMVGVGSVLFTIVSILVAPNDPARIASGVVTGIGFLGAGMIFKDHNSVFGLTSAATIWATAAVGLAVGAGLYLPAFLGAAIVMITPFIPHHHHDPTIDQSEHCNSCGRKLVIKKK